MKTKIEIVAWSLLIVTLFALTAETAGAFVRTEYPQGRIPPTHTGQASLEDDALAGQEFCSLESVECEGEETEEVATATETFIGEVTAYNAEAAQCDGDPWITADGTDLRTYRGDAVVANNRLPFGTVIEVAGRRGVVHDCLNSRYGGSNVDILLESKAEALRFGRQKLEVKVIEYGKGTTCNARRGKS